MADTVESAIYSLRYDTGNSDAALHSTQQAVVSLTDSTDRLETSQQKVTVATRAKADAMDRLLASLSPQVRAWDDYQRTIERVNTLQQAGVASSSESALALDLARQRYDALNRSVPNETLGAFNQLIGVGSQVLGGFGIALGINGVIQFGKSVFDSSAALVSQAAEAKVSIEGLQAYQNVLRGSGLAADETASLLSKLARSAGEAEIGNQQARAAFGALGLTLKDLVGGPEAYLPSVADGLLRIEDTSRRAQIEVALFGRAGQELDHALTELADPTANLIEKQKALGLIMGSDVAEGAKKAQLAIDEFFRSLSVGAAVLGYNVASGAASFFGGIKQQIDEIFSDPAFAGVMALLNSPGAGSTANNDAIGRALALRNQSGNGPSVLGLNLPQVPEAGTAQEYTGFPGAPTAAGDAAIRAQINADYQDSYKRIKEVQQQRDEAAKRAAEAATKAQDNSYKSDYFLSGANGRDTVNDFVLDPGDGKWKPRAQSSNPYAQSEAEKFDATQTSNALRVLGQPHGITPAVNQTSLGFLGSASGINAPGYIDPGVQITQNKQTADTIQKLWDDFWAHFAQQQQSAADKLAESQIHAVDRVRGAFDEMGSSALTNFHSAGDAARKFEEQIVHMAEEKYILKPVEDQLFGAQGTQGGGLIGGAVQSLLGPTGSPTSPFYVVPLSGAGNAGGGLINSIFGGNGGFATLGADGNWTPGPQGFPDGSSGGIVSGLLGGGGGGLGGLISSGVNSLDLAVGGAGLGGGGAGLFADLGSFLGLAALFHMGGIVGQDSVAGRFLHPAYFDDAPRFHRGGIAGDEVPIIAQRGEGIFTPAQMAALGSPAAASGNQTTIHNWHFHGPTDATSVLRARSQIAATVTRAAAQGRRNS